jgi:D-sedoheptulose 7-phosphate isomerase
MIEKRLNSLTEIINQCNCSFEGNTISLESAFTQAWDYLETTKKEKGVVYSIGNGGSAGIASHFSNDLLKTLEIPANTLVDSNILTCIGNDFGYEYIYSVPLERLCREQDLLIAISSSGQSQNIINAVKTAKNKQMKVITFSGFRNENPLKKMGDLNFWLPKSDYGLVEMGHFFLLHSIVDLWKKKFVGSEKKEEELLINV